MLFLHCIRDKVSLILLQIPSVSYIIYLFIIYLMWGPIASRSMDRHLSLSFAKVRHVSASSPLALRSSLLCLGLPRGRDPPGLYFPSSRRSSGILATCPSHCSRLALSSSRTFGESNSSASYLLVLMRHTEFFKTSPKIRRRILLSKTFLHFSFSGYIIEECIIFHGFGY